MVTYRTCLLSLSLLLFSFTLKLIKCIKYLSLFSQHAHHHIFPVLHIFKITFEIKEQQIKVQRSRKMLSWACCYCFPFTVIRVQSSQLDRSNCLEINVLWLMLSFSPLRPHRVITIYSVFIYLDHRFWRTQSSIVSKVIELKCYDLKICLFLILKNLLYHFRLVVLLLKNMAYWKKGELQQDEQTLITYKNDEIIIFDAEAKVDDQDCL